MRRRPPSRASLTTGLNAAVGADFRPLTVVTRQEAESCSTFASEVVTCQTPARSFQLFCKYSRRGADLASHRAHGHRRGVPFEADVYTHILQPLGVSVPALRGVHRPDDSPETWLLLEYLAGVAPVSREPARMPEAAAWIGALHAMSARHVDEPGYRLLPRYDDAYYRGWHTRVRRYARRHGAPGGWLDEVCRAFDDAVEELLDAPQVMIHGEYYPANILIHEGRIRPVDWETAAVACGEIDLASLTEGWSGAVSRACERAYRDARWPNGVPRGFQRRLRAARLYMLFRWAGERGSWSARPYREQWLRHLQTMGERLARG